MLTKYEVRLLTGDEVAAQLRVSPQTIYRRISDGELEAIALGGGPRRRSGSVPARWRSSSRGTREKPGRRTNERGRRRRAPRSRNERAVPGADRDGGDGGRLAEATVATSKSVAGARRLRRDPDKAPPVFLGTACLTPCQTLARQTAKHFRERRPLAKACRKCGETKEAPEFRANPRMRDGLSSWCAECHNAASRRWRDRQRELVAEALEARRRDTSRGCGRTRGGSGG